MQTTTTTAVLTPKQLRIDRARQLGRQGYAISECCEAVGLFSVTPPEGAAGPIAPYAVDFAGRTCNCPDFTGPRSCGTCKHLEFVTICANYVATLARKAVAAPVQPARRRTMGARRVAALAALAPSFAPAQPAAAEYVTITTRGRKILTPAEITRRINLDF